MEDGSVRELRHDFRMYYHVRYEEVDVDEAIDLVLTLPLGSKWRAKRDPDAEWTIDQYRLADLVDVTNLLVWQLSPNNKEWEPKSLDRPGDAARREAHINKARDARRRLEETKWEEVEIG